MSSKPTFSVTHTTARPELWRQAYDSWIQRATHPEQVEYVLCCDERWGFVRPDPAEGNELRNWERFSRARGGGRSLKDGLNKLVWNTGRKCWVDGANIAAAASTGSVILVSADDMVPPDGWDQLLLEALSQRLCTEQNAERLWSLTDALMEREFVLHVSSGTPADDKGLMVLPILSRARYERLGYALYPEYESVYGDDDFTEAARHDGVVIDATHVTFLHDHPIYNGALASGGELDAVYNHENRKPAYDLGRKILERRRAMGFNSTGGLVLPPLDSPPAQSRTIALCLCGENFRGEWLDSHDALLFHLVSSFGLENVKVLRNYTTNVYVTRLEIWDALQKMDPRPDYVLWVDDDNLVSPDQLELLLADLVVYEYDIIAGWSWVHDRDQTRFQVSAGDWSFDGSHWRPFDAQTFPALGRVKAAEVSGFPCVLMRGSVLGQLGPRPFLNGILDERLAFGIGGEDLAFCRACKEAGVTIGVDSRVRVKHLKYMEVIPEFTSRPAAVPKIAVMIRARDEGRWIERVVRSVKELGPVVVMDDHSTDRTGPLAASAGAFWVESPFELEWDAAKVDERRDKDWLLSHVVFMHSPEWVLCIDGDEELEQGGAEKIRKACSSGLAEVFNLRILFLWDRPNQVRLDGMYGQYGRASLFRVQPNLSFQSLYGRAGRKDVHQGLHVGNVPLPPPGAKVRQAALNANLFHYGYMLREDRLRKYEYYNRIDPNNDLEDGYRQSVQGDIPQVPADAQLLHSGPLELRELPASMAPQGWNLTSAREGFVMPLTSDRDGAENPDGSPITTESVNGAGRVPTSKPGPLEQKANESRHESRSGILEGA